mmetsp:Transcript_145103/g.361939  ORF Transcript_145103/g.361939 Transcript_145103/m.361939 type:complete len:216 (+) Transcript_145103:1248-1895(+)
MHKMVAVLEIHMLNSQTETMKPAMSNSMRWPMWFTTEQTMRECKPQRSTARPMKKPATKRKDVPLKNLLASTPAFSIPRSGYKTIGSKLVIMRGTISVNHHRAVIRSTAAPLEAAGLAGSRSTERKKARRMPDKVRMIASLWWATQSKKLRHQLADGSASCFWLSNFSRSSSVAMAESLSSAPWPCVVGFTEPEVMSPSTRTSAIGSPQAAKAAP